MIKFEVKPHSQRRGEVVEVTKDGELIATITADEDMSEIRVISKYLSRIHEVPSAMPGVSPGVAYVALKL